MPVENYNVAEIFEIAEQIERNGAKFYRETAGKFADSEARDFLLAIAAEEDEHEKTFVRLKEAFAQKTMTVETADETVLLYLRAFAGKYIFRNENAPDFQNKQNATFSGALDYAINSEKDSIIFYLGLKDFASNKEDKNVIQKLIDEEKKHLEKLLTWTEKIL